MYCPKCATQNLEDARYCRSCGVNLSLVPKALSGQLSDTPSDKREWKRHRKDEPSVAEGVQKLFMGVGFLLVAIVLGILSRGRASWWYWMLIPAFALLGKGVADIIVAKQRLGTSPQPQIEPPRNTTNNMRAADTGELLPPTSVTEGTTKLFDEAGRPR